MAIDINAYYRRYSPMVYRQCHRMLGDDAKAEDVMQDVFVELLRAEARLKDTAPSSLLYRIATHRCLNQIRSESRRREDVSDDLLARIARADELDGRSTARITLDRIFGLEPESTRTIATLHMVEGMTLEEVAQEVGMSVSGIRKRLRTLSAHVRELEGI